MGISEDRDEDEMLPLSPNPSRMPPRNPLSGTIYKDGLYFATIASGLPGRATPIPDNAAYLFEDAGKPAGSLKLKRPRGVHWRESLFSGEYDGG
jgi:hypothetical protein